MEGEQENESITNIKNSASIIYAKYLKNNEIENMPIFYIGGSQTLPPPLNAEEEAKALKNWQKEIRKHDNCW